MRDSDEDISDGGVRTRMRDAGGMEVEEVMLVVVQVSGRCLCPVWTLSCSGVQTSRRVIER